MPRLAAGALVAIAAVYVSVANVEWDAVVAAFRQASAAWVVLAVASVLLTLSIVTVRWGLLVGETVPAAGGESLSFTAQGRILWDSVVLGQAINILVPLRFGEGARLVITSRDLGVPAGRVMVGLALERAFDVAAFAAIVTTLILSGWMPQAFRGLLPAAMTITVATIAAALLLVRFLPGMLAWLRRRRMLGRAAAWIETQESAMRAGWLDITRRHRLVAVALLTTVIPLTGALTNALVLKSFHLPVPIIAAFTLLAVLQIGTAVVSVPGNVGVFHYLTVVTLGAWNVPPPIALAAAIVLHLTSLGPKVVLAAWSARGRL